MGELIALQEQNRQLKLINIAEKLERENRRKDSRNSSPRLPDSTTEVDGVENKDAGGQSDTDSSSSSSSSSSSDDSSEDESEGGCSSGCCLAQPSQPCQELEQRLQEVEQELPQPSDNPSDAVTDNNEDTGTSDISQSDDVNNMK